MTGNEEVDDELVKRLEVLIIGLSRCFSLGWRLDEVDEVPPPPNITEFSKVGELKIELAEYLINQVNQKIWIFVNIVAWKKKPKLYKLPKKLNERASYKINLSKE